VDQSQSFTSIKQDLLEAIRSTGLTELNGHPLPSDPDDVILGVPIDKNDPDKGWVNIRIPEAKEDDEEGHKSKKVKRDSVVNTSPLGAGLKDGSMVAFRFKTDEEDDMTAKNYDVVMPVYEEEASQPQKET